MSDALDLFQRMRPTPPAIPPDVQVARAGGGVDLHSLAMVPGTPGYNSRIPKPPCFKCGEDHVPNHDYGHPWEAEPVHDEPVSASAIMRRPVPAVYDPAPATPLAEAPQQRVALYVGRGDTYVISVERAPDWDSVTTFKTQPEQVLLLIRMARALGVKVADKTGGDLLALEQEYADARREPAKNYDRGAEGSGNHQPRRQGPDPDRSEEAGSEADPAEAG